MQSVLNKEEQPLVDVYLIILGIPMLSVNQSVLLMQSVQMTKLVSTTIVKIHVLEYVVSMHHVMSPIIFHNVHVILDILGMHLLHVLG